MRDVASGGLNYAKAAVLDRTCTLQPPAPAAEYTASSPPVGLWYHSLRSGWRGNFTRVAGLQPVVGANAYWKAASDAATTDATGYTNEANKLVAVSLVQASPGSALLATGVAVDVLGIGTPTLGQVHALTEVSFETLPLAIGSPTLALRYDFAASSLTINPPVPGEPTLGQKHVLATPGFVHGGPAIGVPPFFGSGVYLPPANVEVQPLAIGSPQIGQKHVLGALPWVRGALDLATPAIAQKHVLTPLGVTTGGPELIPVLPGGAPLSITVQPPVIGTPTFKQIHGFHTQGGFTVGTLPFATPTIGQKHVLATPGLTIAPLGLGLAPLVQKFNLVALGTTIGGPQFTFPAFSKGTLFQVVGLTVGTPALGHPVLKQIQKLSVLGVSLGALDIGLPHESMVYPLTPVNLTLSPLSIGFPVSTVSRALFAQNVEVGSPVTDWQAPYVYHTMADIISPHTDAPIKKALFTNTNDEHALKVAAKSLVGNSLDIKADAEKIKVAAPLTLLAGILGIDLSELEAAIAQLQAMLGIQTGRIDSANVNVASLVASVTSINNSLLQVNTNISKLYNLVSVGKGAINFTTASPVFGTPQIKQTHNLISTPTVLSGPVIGHPVIVRF
jgi:hypothetical protein